MKGNWQNINSLSLSTNAACSAEDFCFLFYICGFTIFLLLLWTPFDFLSAHEYTMDVFLLFFILCTKAKMTLRSKCLFCFTTSFPFLFSFNEQNRHVEWNGATLVEPGQTVLILMDGHHSIAALLFSLAQHHIIYCCHFKGDICV